MNARMKDVLNYFHANHLRIKDLERKIHKRPGKGTVHDFRVATRRIMTIKDVFQLKKPKHLSRMAKASGKVRDLDVGIDFARNFQFDVTEMKNERRDEKDRLKITSKKKDQKAVLKELKKAESELKKKAKNDVPDLRVYLQDIDDELKQDLNEDNAHSLRINLKKARYVLEALKRPFDKLATLQDVLGEIHDIQVLGQRFHTTQEMALLKEELFAHAEGLKELTLDQINTGLSEL